LLEIFTVATVHPLVEGVKLTLRSTLCPAASVSGRLRREVTNSALLSLICEIVTLVAPVFVTVTTIVSVWPTLRAPKRRLGGEDTSCGAPARAYNCGAARNTTAMPAMSEETVQTESE
jgi:hypothetical protein